MSKLFQRCVAFAYPSFPMGFTSFHTSAVTAAARKGTRMKRDALKKAFKRQRIEKVVLSFRERQDRKNLVKKSPRFNDSRLLVPIDNVYYLNTFKRPKLPFKEIVEMHREALHPTAKDAPNADILASIELSMTASKKGKYLSEYSNIILFPHQFPVRHVRTCLALSKDESHINIALEAGATVALGPECVKMAQSKNLNFKEFDHIVAHSSILPDLVAIRTLLRKDFPNPNQGTAGHDIRELVTRFMKGSRYEAIKDKFDFDFGCITTSIGNLSMDIDQLEANLKALLIDVETNKPAKKKGEIITLVNIKCPPNAEYLKIDHESYLNEGKGGAEIETDKQEQEEEEEEEEGDGRVEATF